MGNKLGETITYCSDDPIALYFNGSLKFVKDDKKMTAVLYEKKIKMVLAFHELSSLTAVDSKPYLRIFDKPCFTVNILYLEKKKNEDIADNEVLDETKSSNDINYVYKYQISLINENSTYQEFYHVDNDIKYSEFKKLLPFLIERK